MTASGTGLLCLSCGRDADSADVLIPGIPICKSCLHPVQPVKKRVLIGVPTKHSRVRIVPSLFPPLWPTIPANAAFP
jgi:hypothetical protein